MLQKTIREAINESKMNDDGVYLDYQYDFSKVKDVLLANPDLIDSQDEDGNTLLHHFANPKVAVKGFSLRELLQYNPNPYVKNNDGLTPRLLLISDEICGDKEYIKDVLEAHEQSYISTETGKLFQGIVLMMTKMKSDETGDNLMVDHQENLAVSILNLLGEGNKKISYMRAQKNAKCRELSTMKRKSLIENTLG